jgi:hypothetical protein
MHTVQRCKATLIKAVSLQLLMAPAILLLSSQRYSWHSHPPLNRHTARMMHGPETTEHVFIRTRRCRCVSVFSGNVFAVSPSSGAYGACKRASSCRIGSQTGYSPHGRAAKQYAKRGARCPVLATYSAYLHRQAGAGPIPHAQTGPPPHMRQSHLRAAVITKALRKPTLDGLQ